MVSHIPLPDAQCTIMKEQEILLSNLSNKGDIESIKESINFIQKSVISGKDWKFKILESSSEVKEEEKKAVVQKIGSTLEIVKPTLVIVSELEDRKMRENYRKKLEAAIKCFETILKKCTDGLWKCSVKLVIDQKIPIPKESVQSMERKSFSNLMKDVCMDSNNLDTEIDPMKLLLSDWLKAKVDTNLKFVQKIKQLIDLLSVLESVYAKYEEVAAIFKNLESCIFCKSCEHSHKKCDSKTPVEKRQMLIDRNLCFWCFEPNSHEFCRSNSLRCNVCRSKTHPALFCNRNAAAADFGEDSEGEVGEVDDVEKIGENTEEVDILNDEKSDGDDKDKDDKEEEVNECEGIRSMNVTEFERIEDVERVYDEQEPPNSPPETPQKEISVLNLSEENLSNHSGKDSSESIKSKLLAERRLHGHLITTTKVIRLFWKWLTKPKYRTYQKSMQWNSNGDIVWIWRKRIEHVMELFNQRSERSLVELFQKYGFDVWMESDDCIKVQHEDFKRDRPENLRNFPRAVDPCPWSYPKIVQESSGPLQQVRDSTSPVVMCRKRTSNAEEASEAAPKKSKKTSDPSDELQALNVTYQRVDVPNTDSKAAPKVPEVPKTAPKNPNAPEAKKAQKKTPGNEDVQKSIVMRDYEAPKSPDVSKTAPEVPKTAPKDPNVPEARKARKVMDTNEKKRMKDARKNGGNSEKSGKCSRKRRHVEEGASEATVADKKKQKKSQEEGDVVDGILEVGTTGGMNGKEQKGGDNIGLAFKSARLWE